MDKFASTALVHLTTVAYATALEEVKQGLKVTLKDKTTYGYYKNLAGVSTPLNSFSIKVISKDTNNVVDLLVDDLTQHGLTTKSFLEHGSVFDSILTSYSKDILLVYGKILKLGSINDIIKINNGTLLYYDKSIINKREVDAIKLLTNDIQKHLYEFDNVLFTETDDLYATGLLLSIKLLIETRLPVIRESKVESRQVPDYLISKRLSSYYDLGKVNELPDKIKIWLYHNIPYLSTNIGKQSTFDDLIEYVVKPLNFNVSHTIVKSVHPDEIKKNGISMPHFKNSIFTTKPDDSEIEEDYYSILSKKLNKTLSFKNDIYNNEMVNHFEHHLKQDEDTRYYRIQEGGSPARPLVSKTHLAFDSIIMELSNTASTYTVNAPDGNIYTMSSKTLYFYLIGLILKTYGLSTKTSLTKFHTSTIFTNNILLTPLYKQPRFTELLNDISNTFITTGKAIDIFKHSSNIWLKVSEHLGLHHQPSYTMFVKRIVDSFTSSTAIGFESTNLYNDLLGKGLIIPDNALETLVFVIKDVFDIVVNEQEITDNNLSIVEDILSKLTSYTVEVIREESNALNIPLYVEGLHILEDIDIVEITDGLYDCQGVVSPKPMIGVDDSLLTIRSTPSTNVTIRSDVTPKVTISIPNKTIHVYNKSNITII